MKRLLLSVATVVALAPLGAQQSQGALTTADYDRAVREHLSRETPAREASIERSMRESPIFKAAS